MNPLLKGLFYKAKDENMDDFVDSDHTDPWTFPDPIMQADADLRKQIANLTAQVEFLERENFNLQSYELTREAIERDVKRHQEWLRVTTDEINRRIDLAASLRTQSLRNDLRRLKAQFQFLKNLPAVWRTNRRVV